MTCSDLEILLCVYVDGTLDAAAARSVEEHLGSCAACRELASDARLAVQFMEGVPALEPPPELLTRILFETRALPSHGARPGFFKRFILPLFGPVLQPRFAMGMAMTILSFSMLARFSGVNVRQLKPSDLHPAHVWATVDDKMHRGWDRVVKYYESLRFVYEIQTRLREWTAEEEQLDEAVRQGEIGPDEMPTRAPASGNQAPGAPDRERSSPK